MILAINFPPEDLAPMLLPVTNRRREAEFGTGYSGAALAAPHLSALHLPHQDGGSLPWIHKAETLWRNGAGRLQWGWSQSWRLWL